jgi:DNA-binding transcriptional regulator PaaX
MVGGAISVSLLAPNIAVALDKPLRKAGQHFEKRARERELKRVLHYMKRKKLVTSADYDHGIKITAAGRRRARAAAFKNLKIKRPAKWDGRWRLVFFDIPESKRPARWMLITKLRRLGFQPLQRSVWIHPFPCREEIEAVVKNYDIQRFVTLVETAHIDNQTVLRKRFEDVLKTARPQASSAGT